MAQRSGPRPDAAAAERPARVRKPWGVRLVPALGTAALAVLIGAAAACERHGASEPRGPSKSRPRADAPYQAETDEGLGAAVAILVDTSGSMRDKAPGDSRPKFEVAEEAIDAMLDATDAFIARRPEFPIKIGLYSFSSNVRVIQPIQPYNRTVLRAGLAALPRPGGGTAIGEALREARPDLYRAGVFRKYLLVVTDGENTRGRDPEDVVREIWQKSQGAVQTYFVAFDTSPEKFAFLKEAGGDVIGAAGGP